MDYIGIDAFNGCSYLTSIDIPNQVNYIGDRAFMGCKTLTTVVIPEGVTIIHEGLFADCISLQSVVLPKTITKIETQSESGWRGAFQYCKSLVNIDIPYGVTSIEEIAFRGCSSLSSVTIPSSVVEMGSGVFSDCYNLSKVNIEDLISWCSIKFINEKSNPLCYAHHLFMNGIEITNLQIPDNLTKINDYVFYGCRGFTSVSFSKSAIDIGELAFADCSNIKSLTLPDELRIIRNATFKGCSSLKSVAIPATVEFIFQEAFANCNALESVKAKPSTPPFLYDNSFSSFSVPLEVPKGCKKEYQTAQGWKNFTNISESDKGYYKLIYIVDDEEYKSQKIEEDSPITPEMEPTKEGCTFSGWSEIPETMPAHDVTVTGSFTVNKYKLVYVVDDAEYKSYDIEYDATITSEIAPTKDGYTFSGWSEIPETMPAHDVTITGSFTVNKYALTYKVDDETYKTYEVKYGADITAEEAPTKEGYTFSGWSEIPETMPAQDVTVTGTFTINKYKLIYAVDGDEYKSYEVDYGANITPEPAPTKEGYTFSGWGEISEIMPAHDVTVTGTFTINKYKLIYAVDGEEYKFYELDYGKSITAEEAPTKEGYTFSGWSEIPTTMPAQDVTVTGSFTVNKYALTYKVDDEIYKTYEVEYGADIIAEEAPTKEGYTFSGWSEIPATMPAHDMTVTGTFSINSYKLTYMIDDKVYKETMCEYGATITPEPQPEGDYATFEWTDLPETMPAHDVVVYAGYTSGIVELPMTKPQDVRIYSPNGKLLNVPQKGVNIIRTNDGKTKKIIVK